MRKRVRIPYVTTSLVVVGTSGDDPSRRRSTTNITLHKGNLPEGLKRLLLLQGPTLDVL